MSESLIAVIRDEFAAADLGRITFQPRRHGAEESRYRRYAVELARSFDYLNSRDPRNLSAYADKALGLGSWLFVVGTVPREWKRWLALASFGAFALNRFTLARSLAILADEWDFVDHLDGRSVPGLSIEDRVVASLTEEGAPMPPPDGAPDEYSRACLSLTDSIPARRYDATESALLTMSDFWMEMAAYMQDPNPELAPEFEPAVCALVALAGREGYQPKRLPADVVSFLAPGLNPEPEQQWFARYFRIVR